MSIASTYDRLNVLLFLPTGSRRVRRQFVEAIRIRQGDRVLELGCGTGLVTQALTAAGAQVVAVDRLPAMLERARRRAPSAEFVEADITAFDEDARFDVTVLAFVLHNFDRRGRQELLERAHASTGGSGTVAILDWASPRGGRSSAAWRSIVRRIEPSDSAAEVLDGALAQDIVEAGMSVAVRRPLARGRAELWLAR